ncbi:trafficking protein particle complex subunit 6 [Guillardia theta CCMP2712]|uniref:Trafficking protein particle complex subunit 6 n=1 Tax=Guillardia theta (strain CCMP2712) TaxID=905079 RepID=L1J3R0_GUITC|nr:trafficking protein particle complex subunit 6 [Guillardia theta CCMP2712]EKX42759.1 trafficking protein particle complex subunit 6 [Guillardia theta CCMP2712]|eukprot:XP_005829739.1 trafficking protein particle complex subunit 6 [Guillardia theta CCMP2712]
MSTTPATKREVAESSFDLLHHAIVDKISSSNRNHPEKDLEMIGYTVGQKLVERYVKEKPILENDLAVITFLCKDFWTEVYGKQMDKLRTNHKGVFELQDHRFRALLRVSAVPHSALWNDSRFSVRLGA